MPRDTTMNAQFRHISGLNPGAHMVILFLTGHFVRPKDHLLLRVPPLGRVDTATPDRRVQLLAGAVQQAGRLLLQPPGLLRGLQVQQGEGPRALQVHQDGGRKRGVGSGNRVLTLRGQRVRESAAIQTKRSFVRLSTGLVIIYLLIEPYCSEQLNVWFSSLIIEASWLPFGISEKTGLCVIRSDDTCAIYLATR